MAPAFPLIDAAAEVDLASFPEYGHAEINFLFSTPSVTYSQPPQNFPPPALLP